MGIRVCVTLHYVIVCAQSPSQETFLCIQHKSASLNFTEGEKNTDKYEDFRWYIEYTDIQKHWLTR